MINPIKQVHSDRFIPVRSLSAPKNILNNNLELNENYQTNIQSTRLKVVNKKKQLTFSKSLSTRQQSVYEFLTTLPTSYKTTSKNNLPLTINSFKILDVPNVIDNFYYNVIDVSKHDFVGIALHRQLFMYRESDNQAILFQNRKGQTAITSLKFTANDQLLITGDQVGSIQINDIQKAKTVRCFKQHLFRVGRLEINQLNPSLFYSGSKDYQIHLNDLRQKRVSQHKFKAHKSEVCGLSLKSNLLASGSNDGLIKIWDLRNQNKLIDNYANHKGAVKALTWCPWKNNILVSGGGKKDQNIIIFDVEQKKTEKIIQVNHQITDICWRNSTQELIYSYGKDNRGSIRVDNYFNSKCQNKKMSAYGGRILGLKINKTKDNILISLSANQELRYWDLESNSIKIKANDMVNANFAFQ